MKSKWANFFCISTLLIGSSVSYAEWEPETCLLDEEITNLADLKEKEFNNLKSKVKDYLKSSWCSAEKANLLMELTLITKPQVCVEIGAFTGSSVLPVAATLKHLNQGKVYAVDAWSNAEAIKNLDLDDPNRAWWASVNMKDVQNAFTAMVKSWSLNKFCVTVQNSSEDAAKAIGDIDFLHLDGDYSEVGSLRDVNLFVPKVKSGGYILLSNLFTMVKGKQPKLKSFCALFESCEMVCEIERDNAILFRKR